MCKLLTVPYGLKRAPRLWHAKTDAFLIGELKISSPNDPYLYEKHSAKAIVLIALYVDELLIAENGTIVVVWIKGEVS